LVVTGYPMKIEELKNKTLDQLRSILIDLKKESFNLRFQKANGQLENTARVKVVKRSVARVLTLINNKVKNELEN
jgi:large subunit ribosomal protein L29